MMHRPQAYQRRDYGHPRIAFEDKPAAGKFGLVVGFVVTAVLIYLIASAIF